MADVFMPEEFGKIFSNQHILMLGDSQMRGIYKDFVWFLNHDSIVPDELLHTKLEPRFPDIENTKWNQKLSDEVLKIFDEENRDYLLDSKGLTSGRSFIEPRQYKNNLYNITIHYHFIVKAYSVELEELLMNFEEKNGAKIDTIIMNSCLWDITRNGPFDYIEYKKNLAKLMNLIPKVLSTGSFFWLTSPILAEETQGRGMKIPGLEFQCFFSRYAVIEANYVAANEVSKAGYGVIDLHYLLQLQQFRRRKDGIHWIGPANRLITNLIITNVQLWQRNEEDENGLTGRIGCNPKNKQTDIVWENHNCALEMVKIKANKVKHGLSEAQVTEALQKLEACLQPANDYVTFSKKKCDDIKERVSREKSREKSWSRMTEYKGMNVNGTRFHPYAKVKPRGLASRHALTPLMNVNQAPVFPPSYSNSRNINQGFAPPPQQAHSYFHCHPASRWNFNQGRPLFQPYQPMQWNMGQACYGYAQGQSWYYGQ